MAKVGTILIYLIIFSCSHAKKNKEPVNNTITLERALIEAVLDFKILMINQYPFVDYPLQNPMNGKAYILNDQVYSALTKTSLYNDEPSAGCCVTIKSNNVVWIVGFDRLVKIKYQQLNLFVEERSFKQFVIEKKLVSYGVGFNMNEYVINLDLTWKNAIASDKLIRDYSTDLN
jgi:hypothetical protein